MTPTELVDRLKACGPQELHIVFCYLADRAYEAELADGSKLRDASDFKQWLQELCAASRPVAEFSGNTEGQAEPVFRTRPEVTRHGAEFCLKCGHVHEGDSSCDVYMGPRAGHCDCTEGARA